MRPLSVYRVSVRVRNKVFALATKASFAAFGRRTVLHLPVRINGEERITLGDDVSIGPGSWLDTLETGAISIGSGTRASGRLTVASVTRVTIERNVLFARGVFVTDFNHRFTSREAPIVAQGTTKGDPVVIREGAWLGENAVVLPGVTIGRNAVVGANAVVRNDVPDFGVAVGVPARVLPPQ